MNFFKRKQTSIDALASESASSFSKNSGNFQGLTALDNTEMNGVVGGFSKQYADLFKSVGGSCGKTVPQH